MCWLVGCLLTVTFYYNCGRRRTQVDIQKQQTSASIIVLLLLHPKPKPYQQHHATLSLFLSRDLYRSFSQLLLDYLDRIDRSLVAGSTMKGLFKSKPKTPAETVRLTRDLLILLDRGFDARESKRDEKVYYSLIHLIIIGFRSVM